MGYESFKVFDCTPCVFAHARCKRLRLPGRWQRGEAKVQSTTRTTTLGQELEDLDNAHKKGIISDEEYESKKKELLERKE
ncbi:MAG: SHOCT domain-containing protein [Deltaproteobacteria bacterium]|nr:SHOCT domain-containing protein [Deltaproteobacteria bacterium]